MAVCDKCLSESFQNFNRNDTLIYKEYLPQVSCDDESLLELAKFLCDEICDDWEMSKESYYLRAKKILEFLNCKQQNL